MCRRFALTSPPALLRAHFGYDETPDFPPRAAITPTEPIALVAARPFTGRRHFHLMRWGFLPGFVKDVASFPLIVNARAESLMEKASFAAAFKRRRGLVPADSFYLGKARVQAADGAPLGLAAIYETYMDASGGEIDTACLITLPADGLLSPYGARMPAIPSPADFAAWLDGEATPPGAALALLRSAAPLRLAP